MISKALIAVWTSRFEEGHALIQKGLALALEYELPAAALRASNNAADLLGRRDRCEEATAQLEQGLALARRVGHRFWERLLLGELSWALALSGRWNEALACREQVPEEEMVEGFSVFILSMPELLVAQGKLEEARRLLSRFAPRFEGSADVQDRTGYRAAEAVVLAAEGKEREALAAAEEALDAFDALGPTSQHVKVAVPLALEAALALGERERAERLLERVETLPPGRLAPSLRAHVARFRGRLAAASGDSGRAEAGFATAASTFREFGMVFWLAETLLEHGEWLVAEGPGGEAEPLLAEAREIFERLEAKPWLERADAVSAVRGEPESVTARS